MWRVFEAIVDFLRPRSVQSRVLELALDLQRLDHRLLEVCEAVIQPMDIEKMRQGRVPATVMVELCRMVEFVRLEYLAESIKELVAVAQTTEESLREEFFEKAGTQGWEAGTIDPPRRRSDGHRRTGETYKEPTDGR